MLSPHTERTLSVKQAIYNFGRKILLAAVSPLLRHLRCGDVASILNKIEKMLVFRDWKHGHLLSRDSHDLNRHRFTS